MNTLAIAAEGNIIAGDAAGALRIWDIRSGESSAEMLLVPSDSSFSLGAGGVQCAQVSQLGTQRVAAGYENGYLALWDFAKGTCIRQQQVHAQGTMGVSYSPKNSRLVASCGLDGQVCLVDTGSKTGEPSAVISVGEPLRCLAFHEGAIHCAVGSESGNLLVYDWRNVRQPIWVQEAHNPFPITALAYQNAISSSGPSTPSKDSTSRSIKAIPAAAASGNGSAPTEGKSPPRHTTAKIGELSDGVRAPAITLATPLRQSISSEPQVLRSSVGSHLTTLSSLSHSTAANAGLLEQAKVSHVHNGQSILGASSIGGSLSLSLPPPVNASQPAAVGVTVANVGPSLSQNKLSKISARMSEEGAPPRPLHMSISPIPSPRSKMSADQEPQAARDYLMPDDLVLDDEEDLFDKQQNIASADVTASWQSVPTAFENMSRISEVSESAISAPLVPLDSLRDTSPSPIPAAVPAPVRAISERVERAKAHASAIALVTEAKRQQHKQEMEEKNQRQKASSSTRPQDLFEHRAVYEKTNTDPNQHFMPKPMTSIDYASSNSLASELAAGASASEAGRPRSAVTGVPTPPAAPAVGTTTVAATVPAVAANDDYSALRQMVQAVSSAELQESLQLLRYDMHREISAVLREQVRLFERQRDDMSVLVDELRNQLHDVLQANKELRAENERLRNIY